MRAETDTPSVVRAVLEELRLKPENQTPEEKRLVTLYDEGYVLRGHDDLLKIGGMVQMDGRFYQNGHPASDRALIRRARIDIRGVLENFFGYRLQGDFASSAQSRLVEGWLDYTRYPAFRLRVGQFGTPFSLEGSQSSLFTPLLERSVAVTNLWPAEDIGAMVFGQIAGGSLEYAVGGFNGRFSTGSPRAAAQDDNNDDFDIASRLVARIGTAGKSVLYVGGSATIGNQDDAWGASGETFRTSYGTSYWTWAAGTTHAGRRLRYGGEAQFLRGSFSLQGEYLGASYDDIFRAGIRTDLDVHSGYVAASYVLTGEDKPRSGAIKPRENFDFSKGEWGAWEAVGRWETFIADERLISGGFATGASELDGYSGGLHWWPNRHIMIGADYTHYDFNRAITVSGRGIDHEDIAAIRFQYQL
ncbi:MAG: porin [Candidatus Hydrogenedentota bacterium]